jgi:hypothetical protein
MTFTLGMKIARLIVGALASLAAGATTGAIAPSSQRLPWLVGAILLAAFIPEHIQIWEKFPVLVSHSFSCNSRAACRARRSPSSEPCGL